MTMVTGRNPMRPKIAFCHIHKTAGTTVSQYLRGNYPPNEIFPVDGVHVVTQGLINKINDYSLILGHFPLSFLRAFLTSDWKIFTVLRDPLARFVSHIAYNHQLNQEASGERGDLRLDDYAQDITVFADFQTKFLGAWLSGAEWRYLVASRKISIYHFTDLWNRGGLPAAYRIATEELAQLDFVLDMSDVEGGLRRIAVDCQLWPFDTLPVDNKGRYTGSDAAMESGALEKLAVERNRFDARLLQEAKPHIATAPSPQEYAAYCARWMAQFEPSSVCIAASDHMFLGTGWYGPNHAADGAGFYWSKTNMDQHLYLPITEPGVYEIELSLYLPDRQPGFTIALTYEGNRTDPLTTNESGDLLYPVFRLPAPVLDVRRLQKIQIHSDCSTQNRKPKPGQLQDVGFVISGAMARRVSGS